jgi:hypothetical protein
MVEYIAGFGVVKGKRLLIDDTQFLPDDLQQDVNLQNCFILKYLIPFLQFGFELGNNRGVDVDG